MMPVRVIDTRDLIHGDLASLVHGAQTKQVLAVEPLVPHLCYVFHLIIESKVAAGDKQERE